MLSKTLCCDIFTDFLNTAGEKGLSIIPVEYEGSYKFFLQSRGADYIGNEDRKLIVIEHGIDYCPWCGCNLVKIAKDNVEDISKLAQKNKHLVIVI